jgi:hypothetical protein
VCAGAPAPPKTRTKFSFCPVRNYVIQRNEQGYIGLFNPTTAVSQWLMQVIAGHWLRPVVGFSSFGHILKGVCIGHSTPKYLAIQ